MCTLDKIQSGPVPEVLNADIAMYLVWQNMWFMYLLKFHILYVLDSSLICLFCNNQRKYLLLFGIIWVMQLAKYSCNMKGVTF